MKYLKFFLNGGSSILFLFFGFTVLVLGWTWGLSERQLYSYPVYVMFAYLFIQGLQFVLADVSSITGALLDIAFSLMPAILWLYVTFAITPNMESIPDWYGTIKKEYLMVVSIDLIIFTSASLKMLLFTDKNANAGGRG